MSEYTYKYRDMLLVFCQPKNVSMDPRYNHVWHLITQEDIHTCRNRITITSKCRKSFFTVCLCMIFGDGFDNVKGIKCVYYRKTKQERKL